MRGPCRESVGELDRERDRAPVAAPARGERDRERAPARGEHDRKREERHRAETGNTTSSGEHDRNTPVRASGDPNTSGDVMKAPLQDDGEAHSRGKWQLYSLVGFDTIPVHEMHSG